MWYKCLSYPAAAALPTAAPLPASTAGAEDKVTRLQLVVERVAVMVTGGGQVEGR